MKPGIAWITGASSGIGRELARQLAGQGWRLALIARRKQRLDALAAELAARHGTQSEVIAADLLAPGDLERVAERIAAAPPDLLVNNAGFGTAGALAQLDAARELDEVRTLVLAVVRLTRAALPGMLARGSGAIVNVSSLAGEAPGPYNATYSASKAFVTSFNGAVYEETRGSGVRVMALLPGFTATEFQEVAGVSRDAIPPAARLSAEFVVAEALRDLERGAARSIPGAAYKLAARAEGVLPRALIRRIVGEVWRRAQR
ncbi:MAG: SDR family oxidoreductase [Deltaproteobacteria bacterium]|nr:SDR family oxidoreductase [Deltaproteobacteria bacterium]